MTTLVLVAGASAGHAQTTRSAAEELAAARQAIDAIPPASLIGETARRVDEIRRDLDDLASTFAAQSRQGADASELPGGSWRLKLAFVNSDLRAASGLEQPVIDRLNEVRARLDAFYAAAIAAMPADPATVATPAQTAVPPAPTTTPPAPAAVSSLQEPAVSGLLQRAQTLVDMLLAQNANGSDSLDRAGRVTVDRSTLVEIQTVISQLRAMARSGGASPR